ncbi:MAG: hypothetical protein LBK95_14185 [Bifidobacteriaceae bacterium]|nr:hypothetical protein [Bifidobacteriaceae bacterium]
MAHEDHVETTQDLIRQARVVAARPEHSGSTLGEAASASEDDRAPGREERWSRQLSRMRDGKSLHGPYLDREAVHSR